MLENPTNLIDVPIKAHLPILVRIQWAWPRKLCPTDALLGRSTGCRAILPRFPGRLLDPAFANVIGLVQTLVLGPEKGLAKLALMICGFWISRSASDWVPDRHILLCSTVFRFIGRHHRILLCSRVYRFIGRHQIGTL